MKLKVDRKADALYLSLSDALASSSEKSSRGTSWRRLSILAPKRIKLLEQEAEVMRRAVGYLSRDANPK